MVVDMADAYTRMAEWHAENDPGAWGRHVFFYLLAAQFEIDCKSDPTLHRYPAGIKGYGTLHRKDAYGY